MAVGSLGFSYLRILMQKKVCKQFLCQEGWVMIGLFRPWMPSLTNILNHQMLIGLIFLQ
jgi:hypothetical protein